MCGRFTMFETVETLKRYFPIDEAVCEVEADYNAAPTQKIPVIVQENGKNILDTYHWGLVPFWADGSAVGNRMINARVESIETKPAFRNAFKKRRCLIPADGFYEWKGKKGQKQPMYLAPPDGKPFAFAGLWEEWTERGTQGPVYKSCAIITRQASESVRSIHDRMPVVLKPECYGMWIDRKNQAIKALKDILEDGIITEFKSYPVSKKVNTVENNDPSNLDPLPEERPPTVPYQ